MVREVMRLLGYGVPWDAAWAMSPARRLAFIVAAGEINGGEFDWRAKRWKEPKQ